MREDLFAYALGELDEHERSRVERALAEDEELRQELQQIERCLGGEDAQQETPPGMPRGLADRTAQGIMAWCESDSSQSQASSRGTTDFAAGISLMSPVDMTVALGVLLTIASLLVPALYSNRNTAQRVSCTNNLRELGQVFVLYADKVENKGYFPGVGPNQHAGIFATRLRESGLIRPDLLEELLLCKASPLADQLAAEGRPFRVPSSAELSLAKGAWLLELQRTAAGDMGYQVGYIKDGKYWPAKNRRNCTVPLLADAPSMVLNNRQSANHGGNVVNVLFQDGSVRSLDYPQVPCVDDDLYFNANGEPSAGTTWHDAVVLPSGATPGVSELQVPAEADRIFNRQQ